MNLIGDVAIVVVFWVLFLFWFLYRWLHKRDIAEQRHAMSTALFFLVIMTFVYWLILA